MKNKLFKDYFQESKDEVEVNVNLKGQLAHQLFSNQKVKKPFWTWTKAFFTAPVMVIIALVFFLSSNQQTVKQVLLPQEALAQALENTFNPETLGTHLGLQADGKFYHRTITYDSNYLDTPEGPSIERTDFWTDGVSLRRDSLMISDDSQSRDFRSFLTNPEQDVDCSLVLYKECGSLSEFIEEATASFTSPESNPFGGYPFPMNEENLVMDLSVEQGKNSIGMVYLLKWATLEPMDAAFIEHGSNMFSSERVGINDFEGGHANVLKDGKYWHKVAIVVDNSFIADKKFFQIINHTDQPIKEYSMVYIIDSKDLKISPASTEELIEEIKKSYAPTNVMQGLFYTSFYSTSFFLNRENFTDPIFTKFTEINGENVFQLRYAIPEDHSQDHIFIDLFIDETQTHFLGYTLIRNDKEAESVWIKDEILPDSEKLGLFDQAAWEKSIAEEDKAKEPERQKWLEIENNQNPNEILKIEPINLRNIQ